MPELTDFEKSCHLLRRATFGPSFKGGSGCTPDDFFKLKYSGVVDKLLSDASAYAPLSVKIDVTVTDIKNGGAGEKKDLRKEARAEVLEVNKAWILRMISAKAQLREKMAFFWHDHFACKPKSGDTAYSYVEVLRKHALGNFKTLLTEVSKQPAMLIYLNNLQNRKGKPNENFAREVLELFTLGIGNYSETDIKEAARAFTGWSLDDTGAFKFRPMIHDSDQKTFKGKSGNFTGDDILKIILQDKACASFIAGKIAAYFIGIQPSMALQNKLADIFFESGYEIKPLLKELFLSPEFTDRKVFGRRIKSPIESLVGIARLIELQPQNQEFYFFAQKVLGQVLLSPPNVSGWPSGTAWIDSSTLLFRMNLPIVFLDEMAIDFNDKETFAMGEDVADSGITTRFRDMTFKINPLGALNMNANDLITLIAPAVIGERRVSMRTFSIEHKGEFLMRLLMLPEYQLT